MGRISLRWLIRPKYSHVPVDTVNFEWVLRLSFASKRRIFVFGNCCVVADFGGAHQWAQAHFLVYAPFGNSQQPDNLLVSWDLKSIRCAKLWNGWPPIA